MEMIREFWSGGIRVEKVRTAILEYWKLIKEEKYTFVTILLLMAASLNAASGRVTIVGKLSIAAILGLSAIGAMYFLIYKRWLFKRITPILDSCSIILIILFIGLIIEGFKYQGISVFLQTALVIAFFISMAFTEWNDRKISLASDMVGAYILLNLLVFILHGFPYPFDSYFRNPNALGAFAFFYSFFPFLNRQFDVSERRKKVLNAAIAGAVLLILLAEARILLISMLVTGLVFWKWHYIARDEKTYYMFFGILVAVIALIVILYPLASTSPAIWIINDYVRVLTGANIFSGRDRLWLYLLRIISTRPLLGYGTGAQLSDFITGNLSAHNFYLQTGLQSGILGIAGFVLLFFNIWRLFYRDKDNPYVRTSAAFFTGALIHQMGEVSLTQNNLAIGLLIWIITAIGASPAVRKKERKPQQQKKRKLPRGNRK